MLLLMLTFAAASQNTIHANGQSEKDAYISNGVTQQYRQNITEDIEKRLMNAVNDLAAIHCLLHQEQHVRINFLQEEQLRSELYFLKQVLSDQIKVSGMQQFERPKLLFAHPIESLTLPRGNIITGLAIMNNDLYVGRFDQSVIEVYDVTTLNHRHNLSISGLRCITDLASCPQCDVVYVSDDCRPNDNIYAIDKHGFVVFSWYATSKPHALSVNSQFNVIVTFPHLRKLREFSPRGELIRYIPLQSDIIDPWHAIQLDYDRYAVVHGFRNSLHRVCIVNRNGTLIKSYGGDAGSDVGHLNTPRRMLMFDGSMIVADRRNKRLLLFSLSPLQYTRELISTYFEGLEPYRMTVSEDGTRLFVSYWTDRLKMFNVTWSSGHFAK